VEIDGTIDYGWLFLVSALFIQGDTPFCGAQLPRWVAASRFISSSWPSWSRRRPRRLLL